MESCKQQSQLNLIKGRSQRSKLSVSLPVRKYRNVSPASADVGGQPRQQPGKEAVGETGGCNYPKPQSMIIGATSSRRVTLESFELAGSAEAAGASVAVGNGVSAGVSIRVSAGAIAAVKLGVIAGVSVGVSVSSGWSFGLSKLRVQGPGLGSF